MGGEEKCIKGFKWGNPRERDYLKDLGVDGTIILTLTFGKWDGTWNGLIWLRIVTCGEIL